MKVIWFSNCPIGTKTSKGSGSWLHAMRSILKGSVSIVNITESNVKQVDYYKDGDFEEYIVPMFKLKHGIPSEKDIRILQEIVNKVKPDIIHIWGLEKYWGLLYSRGYIKGKVLIEVQGLFSSCAIVCYAGLTENEILSTYGFKELLKPKTSIRGLLSFYNKGAEFEKEILCSAAFISTQSEWVRDVIRFYIKENTAVYQTIVPIREPFLKTVSWIDSSNYKLSLFTCVSYLLPFKGLHILLKALSILKTKYPNIKLEVAGVAKEDKPFYRRSGYEKMIYRFIKENELSNNVNMLGRLDAQNLVERLKECSIYINSSFVESYSASAAEALCLGVPSVMSYAGALPNFSNEEEVCLYYSPMDYVSLAAKIDMLLSNKQLRERLSKSAIKNTKYKCEFENIKKKQLDIYNDVLMR